MTEPRDQDTETIELTDPGSKTQPAEGGRDEVEEIQEQDGEQTGDGPSTHDGA